MEPQLPISNPSSRRPSLENLQQMQQQQQQQQRQDPPEIIVVPSTIQRHNPHNFSSSAPDLYHDASTNPSVHSDVDSSPSTPPPQNVTDASGITTLNPSPAAPHLAQPPKKSKLPKFLLKKKKWETNFDNGDDEFFDDEGSVKRANTVSGTSNGKSRRSRCSGCFAWYRRWPPFLRAVLYAVSGCAVLIIPGLISLFFYVENTGVYFKFMQPKNGFHIGGYPVFVFSVYLCISWTAWFGLRWAFGVLPEVIVRIADLIFGTTSELTGIDTVSDIVSHYVDYIRHLRGYLAFLFWTVVNFVTWVAVFTEHRENGNGEWQDTIRSLLFALLLSSVVFVVEKLLLQIFAVQFHARAYKERMQQSKEAYRVLECLNKARKRKPGAGGSHAGSSSALASFAPVDSVNTNFSTDGESNHGEAPPQTPDKHERRRSGMGVAEGMSKLGTKAADAITNTSRNVLSGIGQVVGAAVGIELGSSSGVILRTPYDARTLAKNIFYALARGRGDYLTKAHFEPWFESPEDAAKAFAIFDKDNNGDISKAEMRNVVMEMYRERVALERSLRQSSQAINKLDALLKVFVYIIIVFIFLGVLGVDTTHFMAAAISIWAGVLFAVGGTIKNLVESIIFLFLTHPYDVGDRVDIDNDSYVVKEFGLTTTVFRRVDGKEIYAPNIVLAQKLIHNVRRSGNQSEDIRVPVALTTTPTQIAALKRHLLSFLERESREFTVKLDPTIATIQDKTSMVLSFFIEHKGNWQDGARKVERRNKFMFALKEGLEVCGVQLANPSALSVQLQGGVPREVLPAGLVGMMNQQYSQQQYPVPVDLPERHDGMAALQSRSEGELRPRTGFTDS